MKQFEASKKEYIAKLKKDLETVESRFFVQINQNLMFAEDMRSRGVVNFQKWQALKLKYEELKVTSSEQRQQIKDQKKIVEGLQRDKIVAQMETEDHVCQISYKQEMIENLRMKIRQHEGTIEKHQKNDEDTAQQIVELQARLVTHKEQLSAKAKELEEYILKTEDLEMENYKKRKAMEHEIDDLKKELTKEKRAVSSLQQEIKDKEENEESKETQDSEAQTDINLENWDRHMTKVESKASNRDSEKSKGSRVGGGGVIAKPPRNPSSQLAKDSKQELTELNVQGQNSNSNRGSNTQQSLPNLLDKNSRHPTMSVTRNADSKSSNLQKEGSQNALKSSHGGDGGSTAHNTIPNQVGGSVMNTLQF